MFQMYGLGLDTTSSALTLGLSDFGQYHHYQTWDLGRDISLYLHSYLETFLGEIPWPEIAWLVVNQGPGSFTGTRIGMVTARTLAQQLHIPLYGISNLMAQAYAYGHGSAPIQIGDLIAVECPGQRGFVYGSLWVWQDSSQPLVSYQPLQHIEREVWQALVSTAQVQHHLYPNTLVPEDICQAMLTLAHQQWLAGHHPEWHEVLPYYGALAATPSSP